MRAKILTLRFSPNLGRFDDAPLIALQQKVVLEHVREHLVQVGGEAMLVCVTTWREKTDGSSATNATAHAATAEPVAATTERTGPATPVGELRADFTAEQQVLFDLLRRWRKQKAYDEGAPPYVVLTNRQVVDLVRQRPATTTWAFAPRRRLPARSRGSLHGIRAQCIVMSRSAAGAGDC